MEKSANYGHKIRIFGTQTDIDTAIRFLDAADLTDSESADRLIIQELIDEKGMKADILYAGNTVNGKKALVAELKRILKAGTLSKMSDKFYKFLINECGSIAHYDKHGWIATYDDSAVQLCRFFFYNEMGQNIKEYQPHWATDRTRIAEEFLEIAENYLEKQSRSA